MRAILYISGTIGCMAIIFGALFKIQHYSGGNELFTLGAAILGFVYVPVFAIMRFRKGSKSSTKQ
jgi:hypothetical protein